MPNAQRLLEAPGQYRTLQNGAVRDVELFNPDSIYFTTSQVNVVYPKTGYAWTDRTGITVPDVTGPMSTTSLVVTGASQAGTLIVTADGTASSMAIGIAVVLWDERSDPLSVISGMINLSGWLKNAAGHYIPTNGAGGMAPGFLAIDISLAAGYTVLVQSILPAGTVNLHTRLF